MDSEINVEGDKLLHSVMDFISNLTTDELTKLAEQKSGTIVDKDDYCINLKSVSQSSNHFHLARNALY